ncbi:hypothetical protein HDU88_002442 [Geranomyces variabilis]|nr:hypothetical protein HDU88_002442 [Geranomyces variabilis]
MNSSLSRPPRPPSSAATTMSEQFDNPSMADARAPIQLSSSFFVPSKQSSRLSLRQQVADTSDRADLKHSAQSSQSCRLHSTHTLHRASETDLAWHMDRMRKQPSTYSLASDASGSRSGSVISGVGQPRPMSSYRAPPPGTMHRMPSFGGSACGSPMSEPPHRQQSGEQFGPPPHAQPPHYDYSRPMPAGSPTAYRPGISHMHQLQTPPPPYGCSAQTTLDHNRDSDRSSARKLCRKNAMLGLPLEPTQDPANQSLRSEGSGYTTQTSTTQSSALESQFEHLEEYRRNARKSNDPEYQLQFAKHLIATGEAIPLDQGDDIKRNKRHQDALYAEALKLIKKLTTSGGIGKPGHADAQFFLAECYGNGTLNLDVNHDHAFALYMQASKQSHPAAAYRTAVCYEAGAGTKRDFARAMHFYRKAAVLGDTAAMYKLGMVLKDGLLGQVAVPRDGVSWLRKAADQADEDTPHALHELGVLYEDADAAKLAGLIPDPRHAHELFLKAARLNYTPSQLKLGFCYEYGLLNCTRDARRSIAWYTQAAQQSSDPEAELALSGWYLTGAQGVLQQSDTEAYQWARKAADKGLPKAQYAVGWYSENGVGVQADLEEARRWYRYAAVQGDRRAQARAKELKMMMYATQRGSGGGLQQQHYARSGMGGSMRGERPLPDVQARDQAKDSECVVM